MDINEVSVDRLHDQEYTCKGVQVDMLRLDRIDPFVSGNKWFKIKYNAERAAEVGAHTLLSFGGGYSNHLYALAHFGQSEGWDTMGIVRGEELTPAMNTTLAACVAAGMKLVFVSREEYRAKEQGVTAGQLLQDKGVYMIPEGGNNELGKKGAGEIVQWIPKGYTHIAVAAGTGTTLLGMLEADSTERQYLAFAAVKQEDDYTRRFQRRVKTYFDEDFGGFGKYNEELLDFMRAFYHKHGIRLDVVYTGKMMYALHRLIVDGEFRPEDKILCVHTGGLQGNPIDLYTRNVCQHLT